LSDFLISLFLIGCASAPFLVSRKIRKFLYLAYDNLIEYAMLALTVCLSRAISFLKWFDLVGCELLDEKLVWFRYLRERNKYMRKWRHGKHDKNHYPGMTASECQRSHCLKYFTEIVGSGSEPGAVIRARLVNKTN
jgi:hypothetical protein